jgi:probable HAF family extracellular repeat protein
MNKGEHMRKNNYRFFVISALVIIVLALHPLVGLAFEDTSATQPVSYSFISIDIPNLSGSLGFTSLADINNDGEITGGFTNSSGFGFLLGETFQLTDIQCPGDTNAAPNAQPQSINKRGEISGFCSTGGRLHGFFRDKKGQYTLLDFPGAILTEAVGINDNGQVVGDYRDSEGRFHGFFWDAGLFLTFDVPFPEATSTGPNGINNVGQIVGFYFDNNVSETFPNGHAHGFLYDNGVFSSFDVPGASVTVPTDINDHGQIVGVYGDSDSISPSFLLEDGHFTSIEAPFPHVVFTDVSGINNRGQIVGRYLTTNPADVNNIFNHGLIATPVPGRPSSTAQLAASPAPTVARADGVATPARRLSLDACPGVVPQDGSVTPAKLSGRWISCSQAVVPE